MIKLKDLLPEKAVSKQQQKFFGVVKAMQSGDIPKEGEAGEAAKEMSKKEVDKYAGTKHKGLPDKVDEIEIIDKRLNNPSFIKKAPPKVIEDVKTKKTIFNQRKLEINKALLNL